MLKELLSYRSIRLSITDRFPFQPSLLIHRTEWLKLFSSTSQSSSSHSKHTEAYGPSHTFTIPLPTLPNGKDLPGCLHLEESNAGQVVYDLTVKAVMMDTATGSREEMKESHEIHITPTTTEGSLSFSGGDASEGSNGAGPSRSLRPSHSSEPRETSSDRTIRKGKAEAKLRLLISKDRVRNHESLPVGVEIRQMSRDDEGGAGALRGLRRVKLEWWRRIRF